jgi:hypothetical protein
MLASSDVWYSATEHLAASVFPAGYGDALFSMFAIYFDDSGTHSESDIAVAACYVGDCEQWKCLERDWENARKAEGFKVFGMADVLGGNGEYRTWPDDKRDRLIRRLITVARIRARIGYSYSVIKSEYDAEITDKLREKVGKFHYTFMVRNCLNALRKWRSENQITGPMQYVFDRMGKGKGEIEAVLDELVRDGDAEQFGIDKGGYSFQSKEGLAPLQAVDILAHESYRHMRHILSPTPNDDDYMPELSSGPLETKYWRTEHLKTFAEGCTRAFAERGWGEPLTPAKGPKLG